MRIGFLPLALLAALSAWGQPSPPLRAPWPAETNYTDLFDRVAASDYVAVVSVSKVEWVLPRWTPEQLEWLRRIEASRDSTGLAPVRNPFDGGKLYTLDVRRTVCRQADFQTASSGPHDIAGPVYIFIPEKESWWTHTRVERLALGGSYLIFIAKDPAQPRLAPTYELDQAQTYYRAYQENRGAIQLPPEVDGGKPPAYATALLSAVTSLCDAVRPANPLSKISWLTALRLSTGDPGIKHSAEAALRAFGNAPEEPPK